MEKPTDEYPSVLDGLRAKESEQEIKIIAGIDDLLRRLHIPGSEEFIGQSPLALDILEEAFKNLKDEFQRKREESVSILPVVFGESIRNALDKAITKYTTHTKDAADVTRLISPARQEIKRLIQRVFSDTADQLQVFYTYFR